MRLSFLGIMLTIAYLTLGIETLLLSRQNAGLKKALGERLINLKAKQVLIEPGAIAPAFSLELSEGGTYDYPTGHQGALLLIFFRPDCYSCIEDLPSWYEYAGLVDEDFEVLLISEASAPETREFLLEHGLTIPTVVDSSGQLARAMLVQNLPQKILIDSDRVVRDVALGFRSDLNTRPVTDAIERLRMEGE